MDNYRKVKNIGRGCYGKVDLMERKSDLMKVAVKRILLAEENYHKIHQEVQILQSLNHPNIIHCYENFIHDNVLYIVMEYAEGGDLQQRIVEARDIGRNISEEEIWKLLLQIIRALSHMHSMKVIHRDLKTSNILLDSFGEVKIADFGIARMLAFSDELAQTGVGTPYYLAPEICQGCPYDTKADIWSLGCIAYELAALQRPFRSDSLAGVLGSILSKSPPKVSSVYSAALREFVDSLLQKDPLQRPSAEELLKKYSSPRKKLQINIPSPTQKAAPLRSTSNSLLKQCPVSPSRPFLICDFLRKKLGDEVFDRVKEVLGNTKDPSKLISEEPWIITDICGEENINYIDVGITFGAFDVEVKTNLFRKSTN